MDMHLTSPYVVALTDPDRAMLQARLRAATTLNAMCCVPGSCWPPADGDANAQIARDLGVHVDTVRKWRRRYCTDGLDGLRDLPRPGRPPAFTAIEVASVKALACSEPDFATKAARVLDLYARRWNGRPLGETST